MLITALFVTGKESWKLSLAAGTELSLPVSPSVVFGVPLVCRDLYMCELPQLTFFKWVLGIQIGLCAYTASLNKPHPNLRVAKY